MRQTIGTRVVLLSLALAAALVAALAPLPGSSVAAGGPSAPAGLAPIAERHQAALLPVSPVLECVVERGPSQFTAYFGYYNRNAEAVSIPVGPGNKFTPAPQDRGQPTTFAPGRQRSVFSVDYPGTNLVWTLSGRTSTAGAGSKRCADPTAPAASPPVVVLPASAVAAPAPVPW